MYLIIFFSPKYSQFPHAFAIHNQRYTHACIHTHTQIQSNPSDIMKYPNIHILTNNY